MPAIPIYTASPINASKASGVTPQTAHSGGEEPRTAPVTSTQPPATYPAAQPGARPSIPAPTGVPQAPVYPEPTPTRAVEPMGPPAPQPGAVPVPPSRTIPPPPKVGETLGSEKAQPTQPPMPPQMTYVPLGSPDMGAKRSSTTTTTVPMSSPMAADPLGGRLASGDLSHPPGYQQNVHASEFSSTQRAAHQAAVDQDRSLPAVSIGDDGEGVWDAAKKWATAAGEGLAAAENEVWKRINKE